MPAAKDPICGMSVDPAKAPAQGVYDGQPVYFCSVGCQKAFVARRGRA
jgi:P-type Cu+ transporter